MYGATNYGQYGGCGTFLRLTRDPAKKLCLLEQDIARHEKNCARGWRQSCKKLEAKTAELAAFQGTVVAPQAPGFEPSGPTQEEVDAEARAFQVERAAARRRTTTVALSGVGVLVLLAWLRGRGR